jgi:glycosyl hydrolase family 123
MIPHRHLMIALTALLALALLNAGCAAGPALDHWFVDSLTKVFPDDESGAHRLANASFDTARNANLSIQLALRAPRAVGDLYVEVLPLTGPGLPIETARVRWVEYVVVTTNTRDTPPEELVRPAPTLFPDAVLEEFPITVRKNETRSIWITLPIPANQAPGDYQGQIRLRQGDEQLALIPFALTVHSAAVPSPMPLAITNYFNLSDRHLQQFYGVSPYSDAWWDLMQNIAGFMGSYYQSSVRGTPVDLVNAEVRGGRLHYDFSHFERYVHTFERAGVKGQIESANLARRERIVRAPIMVRAWIVEAGQAVRQDIPWSDPRARQFLNSFLPELQACLRKNGWTERYLQGIIDEPHEWERETFVEIAELVRRHMPGVRTIEPVGARQDLSFMEKTVDIWVPQLGTFDDKMDMLRQHVDRGGELWYYTALSPRGRYPNRFIDYSLTKVRLLHWINFKYDFGGFLHWGGNFWGPEPFMDTQPVINQGRTYLPPGDAYITYPDRLGRTLYSSIRLEQMREGIEDFGLLTELAKTDEPHARRIADEMVQSFTDYVRDPARFREIQRELLEAF